MKKNTIRIKSRLWLPKCLTLAAALAVSTGITQAGDILWTGGTASYNTPGDWSGGVIPGATDNAINDNSTANAVVINIGDPDWKVGQIRAGNSAGNGAFVQNGQTVTPLGTNYNGPVISEFFTPFRLGIVAAHAGVYTLNGGTLNYGTGPFHVGEVGTGTLNLNGGNIVGSGVFYVNSGGIAVPNPAVITGTAGHGPYLGDSTYYEVGYSTTHPTTGLPAAGSTIVSVTQGDHSYQFAPTYTANNAVILDAAVPSATITLAIPTACSALSFVGSAGNGPVTNNYTVHYASGASDTGTLIISDWFGTGQEVLNVEGRVDGTGVNFQYPGTAGGNPVGNAPYLLSTDITLVNTDKVVRIDLTYVGGNGNSFATATILGVSGQATVSDPFLPLAITGYNADVVVEAAAPSPFVSTSVMDTVTQTGGTNAINNGLFVAQGSTAHGTYNLSNGEIDVQSWTVIGRNGGRGVFNMSGGTINKAGGGSLIVGSASGDNGLAGTVGTLNQSGGTINDANEYWIAENALTIATNNFSGTAVLNVSGNFELGNGGTAVFNQTGGTNTVNGELHVASGGASSGTYNMSGGVLNAHNWFQIGRGGAALLNFTGGTINKDNGGNFIIGDNATVSARVIQTGAGTTFNDANEYWIGNNTTGELDLTNGVLNTGTLIVGNNGGGTVGTFEQSGGTVTANGQFWVGQGGGKTGLYDLSGGGTITVHDWVSIGRNGGSGTVNLDNGSITKVGGGAFSIGGDGGAYGTLNQSAGTSLSVIPSVVTYLGQGTGNGTWNINGGSATLGILQFCEGGNGSGLLNFNGGVISAAEVNCGAAGANGTFNFNGGTLRAVSSTGKFLHGVPMANVQGGGAIIDSQGFNVTVSQNLADGGGGGLIKLGSGTLTLTGANSYTGPTAVAAGILGATTASTTSSSGYTAANGAGFSVQVVGTADSQFSVPSVTFSSSATTLDVDLNGLHPTVSAPLNVTGTLTVNGTVTVNLFDSAPAVGTFPLVKYFSKTGSGTFVLGTLPAGVQATLVNNTGNSSIDLHITQTVATPRWDGSLAGGAWDINTTANWYDVGSLPALVPTVFQNGMAVLFDDNASNPNVTLNTTVNPKGVTVNNSMLAYTVVGSGKITGTNGLVKQGTAALAILNTGGNDYTGPTVISSGTLSVNSLADGGVASSIGAASADAANLVLNGGSLSYSGPAVAINRGYSVQVTNSSIITMNNLTLSGAVTATSGGGFTKSGLAELAYTTVGGNVLSGLGSSGYGVTDGSVVFGSAVGRQSNSVQGDLVVNGVTSNATITMTNTDVTVSSWLHIGGAANTVGTMTVQPGTTLNVPNGRFFLCSAPGTTATLNINGGVINKDGDYFAIVDGGWNGSGDRTGTVNQMGGTINSTAEMWIAQTAPCRGFYNLSGGTMNLHNYWFGVGRGGEGTFNMTGGTINKDGGRFIIGTGGSIASFNQSGGTINCASEYWLGENSTTYATNNISGTAAVNISTWVTIGRDGHGDVNMSGGTFKQTGGDKFVVGIYGSGNGAWNQTGGSLTTDNEIWIGQNGGAQGVVNLSGGTITNNSWLAVGREGGTGTLNISGGKFVVHANGGNTSIAHGGGTGTVTISGTGFIDTASGQTWIGEDSNAGVWNNNGGTTIFGYVQLARNSSASGTLDLNGGTVTANEITTGSAGTSTLNFNGGTLIAGTSTANYLHGLTAANVLAGGALINTSTNVISIAQALLDGGGNGGLAKTGNGTLALNGANTYTGTTTVSAGTLGGNGIIVGPVVVAAGATLSPGTSIGTLTINNTLNLAGTSKTVMELNKTAGTSDSVAGVTTVTYGGTLVLKNVSGALQAGDTFTLFSAGTHNGSFSSVVSQTPNQTVTWDVSQLTVNGTVKVATAVAAPVVLSPVVNGGSFNLAWPADQIGWQLQSQVNGLNVGISTNWVPVAGSTTTNQVSLPEHSTEATEFFRLVFPAQ